MATVKEDVQFGEPEYTCNVGNCARCQQDHKDVDFFSLNNPPDDEWAHYAICPTNGQPIWGKKT